MSSEVPVWEIQAGARSFIAQGPHADVVELLSADLGSTEGIRTEIKQMTARRGTLFPTTEPDIARVIPGSRVRYPEIGEPPSPAQRRALRKVSARATSTS